MIPTPIPTEPPHPPPEPLPVPSSASWISVLGSLPKLTDDDLDEIAANARLLCSAQLKRQARQFEFCPQCGGISWVFEDSAEWRVPLLCEYCREHCSNSPPAPIVTTGRWVNIRNSRKPSVFRIFKEKVCIDGKWISKYKRVQAEEDELRRQRRGKALRRFIPDSLTTDSVTNGTDSLTRYFDAEPAELTQHFLDLGVSWNQPVSVHSASGGQKVRYRPVVRDFVGVRRAFSFSPPPNQYVLDVPRKPRAAIISEKAFDYILEIRTCDPELIEQLHEVLVLGEKIADVAAKAGISADALKKQAQRIRQEVFFNFGLKGSESKLKGEKNPDNRFQPYQFGGVGGTDPSKAYEG